MGWFGGGKDKDKGGDKGKSDAAAAAPSESGKKPGREEIRAQALENARRAREAIGEDTLQKIAAAMQKKQESDVEKARAKIKSMDSGRVADNIKAMIDEKRKS